MKPLWNTVLLTVCCTVLPAHAQGLDGQSILQQFNLVTLGDATLFSHVDGRSYVSGNLTGQGAVLAMHPANMPGSAYSGLTVAGNASNFQVTAGGLTVAGNVTNGTVNNGPAVVGGDAQGASFNGTGGSYVFGSRSSVNANSGALSSSAAQAQLNTATSTDFDRILHTTSTQLSQVASTGSNWVVSGSHVTFNAVVNGQGLAVFDLTGAGSAVLSASEFSFNLNGASTVLFNSDVTSATVGANFLDASAQAIGSKTLWNFYNATSLTLNSQFGGTILAADATLTNRNNIEGGVFVDTLQQYGEIHEQAFTGSLPTAAVPEPGTGHLMLAGLMAGLVGLRRRKAVATLR